MIEIHRCDDAFGSKSEGRCCAERENRRIATFGGCFGAARCQLQKFLYPFLKIPAGSYQFRAKTVKRKVAKKNRKVAKKKRKVA